MNVTIENKKLNIGFGEHTAIISNKEVLQFLSDFNNQMEKIYRNKSNGYKRIPLFEQEDGEQTFFAVYLNPKRHLEFEFYNTLTGEMDNFTEDDVESTFSLLTTLNKFLYAGSNK